MKYRVVVTVEQRGGDFESWQDAGYRIPLGGEVEDFARLQRVLTTVKAVEDLVPGLSI